MLLCRQKSPGPFVKPLAILRSLCETRCGNSYNFTRPGPEAFREDPSASLLTSLPSSMTKRPLRVIEEHRPLVFILASPVILVLRLHYPVCSRRRRWASSRQSRVCRVRRRILGLEVFADALRFPVCKQPLTASPSKVPGDSGRCSHPRQYPRCGQCCCAKRPDCVWWSSCNYPPYPPARAWNDAERAKARHPVSEPFLQTPVPPRRILEGRRRVGKECRSRGSRDK